MSGLLEKLKTKNTPQTKKTFTVTFSKPGFVRDESKTTEFNANVFREFLSNRFEKIRPKIDKPVDDKPEKIMIKPKKTKKRLKLKSSTVKEEKMPKLSKVEHNISSFSKYSTNPRHCEELLQLFLQSFGV